MCVYKDDARVTESAPLCTDIVANDDVIYLIMFHVSILLDSRFDQLVILIYRLSRLNRLIKT